MAEYIASVQQDDDDDDDDEADFQPGDDEEDDDDDDDEGGDDDDEDAVILKGTLEKEEGGIVYRGKSSEGDTFDLKSQPLRWSLDAPTATTKVEEQGDPPGMRTITLEGQFLTSSKRTVDITITRQQKPAKKGKSTGEDGDDDDHATTKKDHGGGGGGGKLPPKSNGETKSPAKKSSTQASSTTYSVFGKGPHFEFYGEFCPRKGYLECKYRQILKAPPGASASSSAAAGGGGSTAAAAAAATVPNIHDDDDIENDVDEGVDPEELIALRKDAGMPIITNVRKRYATRSASKPPPAKRAKSADDSDEEIGF
uniref:Uncharacterized protein n=1 Tax=Cyclophora tenuis TaxID=216820 RepID=A0A7S1DBN4_CYCTE